jgi:ribonuclease HI
VYRQLIPYNGRTSSVRGVMYREYTPVMNDYCLFTDVSVNPALRVGVGGYLIVPESIISTPSNLIEIPKLEKQVVLRRFDDTSSTKLEVQTVLWALEEYCRVSRISSVSGKLHLYTDSQCVEGLLSRRTRLESSGFTCRGGSHLLKNATLYSKYYAFYDLLRFDVTKVAGHTRFRSRNTVQHVFSLIDQKVRNALKSEMNQV